MVYNATRHAKLPFSNAIITPHTKRVIATGSGMGSVLLRTAGPGAGSSYQDIDDYIRTTGIDPYASKPAIGGKINTTKKDLSNLASKLSSLKVSSAPGNPKRKNITMSF